MKMGSERRPGRKEGRKEGREGGKKLGGLGKAEVPSCFGDGRTHNVVLEARSFGKGLVGKRLEDLKREEAVLHF